MAFEITYSPEAIDHLFALTKFEQTKVLDQVDAQLTHQPQIATRKRKLLRPNTIAPWELRIDDLRVFYQVQELPVELVTIKAVGKKSGNQLWIGGVRIDL
jgi:mRNA-degrading endonuclease RelE of RelBE toxin-antitoxin system